MESFTPRPVRPTTSAERRLAIEAPVKTQPIRHDSPSSQAKQSSKKSKPYLWIGIILAVILVAVGSWFFLRGLFTNSGIDNNKFQAVFLTSGQVYFGRMQVLNDNYIKLTDVFYIQADAGATDGENPQDTTNDSSSMQLIKLGNEIHGPEDMMIINREQVLFYENLKDDGKVAQTIRQYQEQ